MSDTVRIHYLRPPTREEIFEQRLVLQSPEVVVTLMERTPLPKPMRIDDRIVLEPGSPVVWFTFPGAWHDVGRFHTADGAFTGIYANVLTPVVFRSPLEWSTTDLFLDVWIDDSGARILDEEELDAALLAGSIDAALADAARREATRLVDAAAHGGWPPAVVEEWTLARALERLGRAMSGIAERAR